MIPTKNLVYYLKLSTLISFLFFTLSQFLLALSVEYNYFLENTFLSTFSFILANSFFNIALVVLRAISIFMLIGCLLAFLIYVYYDYVKEITLK